MNVLLLGARGFIGRHTAVALRAAGHDVVCGETDFSRALQPADWLPSLAGIDAVVNAVGIIREHGTHTFHALHEAAPQALFAACQSAGVRRVVQISALGADDMARSRFHRTKKRADDYLASLDLDWTVVQPSLVFGEGGASARLFALLASLPLTPLPGDGGQRLQPIHIDDLAELIATLVSVPVRNKLHAVGPREITLRGWLGLLRAQMGLGKARFVEVPRSLIPVERETLQMLDRGNTGSAVAITRLLNRAPRDPNDFLDAAQGKALATQAKLGWLLPMLRASIAAVWIVSGVVSLGLYPVSESLAMLARVGFTGPFALMVLYGSAFLDIGLGIGVFLIKRRRWLWRLQMAVIAGYSAIIAVWLPELWLHPFGPVLKNLPMLAALLALHELEGR